MTKKEQWGNIELPGVSDEELLSKNWNKVAGANALWKNHRDKAVSRMTGVKRSPEACAKMSASQKARTSYGDSQHPQTLETRAKISAKLKGHEVTAETRAKISATIRSKPTPPKRARIGKPIQTPEGIFDTVKSYAAHCGVAIITVYKRIEKHPDQYYYINKDTV